MKVSIITTCYNREATIRDCIESVLAQDYSDIEYIVIDGASKDNSMSVINEYKDRIATIVSEPDGGMYEAINKGIRYATGDVIGLMHSDDFFYSKDCVSQIVKAMQSNEADIVYGDGLFVNKDNPEVIVRKWISRSFSKFKMRLGWLPLHPTVYVKSDCIRELGLYDESYRIAADSDFLVRYFFEGKFKIHYLGKYVVRMRMGGLSTDPKKVMQKWKEDLRMYKSHGFLPTITLACKIVSKVPQFVEAKFVTQ